MSAYWQIVGHIGTWAAIGMLVSQDNHLRVSPFSRQKMASRRQIATSLVVGAPMSAEMLAKVVAEGLELEADLAVVDAVCRRVRVALEIARAKAAGQTPHFQSLVAARDAAGLEQAITQPAVEEQVIARARTAARELCNPALATDFPDLIAGIYRDWIIPLARRVQVETLLAGK